MPIAVQRKLVTGSGDLGRKSLEALDLLPDEKERRSRSGPCEQLENRRRSGWVRAVVEGKGYSSSLRQARPNA